MSSLRVSTSSGEWRPRVNDAGSRDREIGVGRDWQPRREGDKYPREKEDTLGGWMVG